jgi:hypothetical protein
MTDFVCLQILPSLISERPIVYASKIFLDRATNDRFSIPANSTYSELRKIDLDRI